MCMKIRLINEDPSAGVGDRPPYPQAPLAPPPHFINSSIRFFFFCVFYLLEFMLSLESGGEGSDILFLWDV